MHTDLALKLFSDLLLTALFICGPILLLTLLVGLAVSILQVITQIQDSSLTFIPKIIATVGAIIVFGPWMLRKLLQFATNVIANIPNQF